MLDPRTDLQNQKWLCPQKLDHKTDLQNQQWSRSRMLDYRPKELEMALPSKTGLESWADPAVVAFSTTGTWELTSTIATVQTLNPNFCGSTRWH